MGDEGGGEGGVASANYNYTHTGRHTIPHSIPPSKQQHKEAHKGKQTCPSCCCSGTKGSEKQHEKKARETRVRDDGVLSSAFSTHSPLCSFGGSALLYSQCTGPDVEEPCLILSMKIKLQIDTCGDSN